MFQRNAVLVLSCNALLALGGSSWAQDLEPFEPVLGSTTVDQVYTAVTPCRFVDGINAADRVATAANNTTAVK